MSQGNLNPNIEKIINNIEKVMCGKRNIVELCIVALLAEGHVLLEDVPGLGKTMMVRALAKSISGIFRRIQFTPDLLPSDIVGVSIFNPKELAFQFRPGPLMGNIILADEINRTSPKTQSALLEGMEESSVTIDGETHYLNKPFFIVATQNPLEFEGTYSLPEAQLDRFLLKIKMGYPEIDEEIEILSRAQGIPVIDQLSPVINLEELRDLQTQRKAVYVGEEIKRYIVDIVRTTREHEKIELGVSPRGSISLMKAVQAYALINGRDFVIPDDIQYLASFVMCHRMILQTEAKFDGVSAEEIIAEILSTIPVPITRMMK